MSVSCKVTFWLYLCLCPCHDDRNKLWLISFLIQAVSVSALMSVDPSVIASLNPATSKGIVKYKISS